MVLEGFPVLNEIGVSPRDTCAKEVVAAGSVQHTEKPLSVQKWHNQRTLAIAAVILSLRNHILIICRVRVPSR